jgi:hypothetical protein
MGYTQYWKHTGFTDEQWKKLVTFTRNFIQNTKTPIVNGSGDRGTSARVDDTKISFNGEGDESCETFHLTKVPQDFEFCKTREYPYDYVVVEVMREAMTLNPNFHPSSDGGWAVFGTKNE